MSAGKISRAMLATLATITLTCDPEDIPYVGNCMASGDDAEDRKQEAWVREQLESGNEWAWCQVVVTASFAGVKGYDSLGCCSYLSESDFKAPDGYYPDLVTGALDELFKRLTEIEMALVPLRDMRADTCKFCGCTIGAEPHDADCGQG